MQNYRSKLKDGLTPLPILLFDLCYVILIFAF
jgi:hypothetical protein